MSGPEIWPSLVPSLAPEPANKERSDRSGSGIKDAILSLRVVISNGDFDECWRFHLAREHQRLYPGTAQGQYALSV